MADGGEGIFSTSSGSSLPSTTIYIDEAAPGAADLSTRFSAVARAQKTKIEIALVPDAPKALRKERQIVTGDADTLDACAGWLNLVGHVVEAVPGAKIVRLQ